VQHGAILRHVDLFPAEQRLDAGLQAAGLGERDQGVERGPIDAVFRVVEMDTGGVEREVFGAF